MHSHARKFLVSLSLFTLGGCDLKRELVGETLPLAESGGSTSGDTTDGEPTDGGSSSASAGPATTAGATTTADPTDGAPDGTPCELGPPEAWEEGNPPEPGAPVDYHAGPYVTPSSTCAGEVCLYAVAGKSTTCDADADCVDDDRHTGICNEPWCEIDPAWGEAHTSCTSRCEVDTDCPVIPGCNEGSVCAVLSQFGSLCCEKVCGCRDELDEGVLDQLATKCKFDPQCPGE